MRRQLVYCGNHGGLMSLKKRTVLCTEQASWADWVLVPHATQNVSWCAVVIRTGKHLRKP